MKVIIKTLFVTATFLFAGSTIFAQTEGTEAAKEQVKNQNKYRVNEQQKAMVQEMKQNARILRDEFKESLTEEQLAILENTELSMQERMDALKATLSEDQMELLDCNLEGIKEQKREMKGQMKENAGEYGNKKRKGKGNGTGIM